MAKLSIPNPSPNNKPTTDNQFSLEQVCLDALKVPKETFTTREKTTLPESQVVDIIQRFANHFDISPPEAYSAIAVLMLKGASNANAPGSMSIEMKTSDGRLLTIQKHDILTIYRRVTDNDHIRRLAETLGVEISEYALANKLDGDLAKSFNNKILAKGDQAPLTPTERAWSNSFLQDNPKVSEVAPRIAQLLIIDYVSRFPRKTNTKQKTASTKPTNPKAPAKAPAKGKKQ